MVAELLFSSLLPQKVCLPHTYIAGPSASSEKRIWKLPPWIKKVDSNNFPAENPELLQEATLNKIRRLKSLLATSFSRAPWTVEQDRLHEQPREQNFEDIWEREEGKRLEWGSKVLISGGSQIAIPVKACLLLPGGSPQPKTPLKVLGWSKHAWWQMESPEAATSSMYPYSITATTMKLLLQSSWINQTVLACHHIFPSTDLPFQPHAWAREPEAEGSPSWPWHFTDKHVKTFTETLQNYAAKMFKRSQISHVLHKYLTILSL